MHHMCSCIVQQGTSNQNVPKPIWSVLDKASSFRPIFVLWCGALTFSEPTYKSPLFYFMPSRAQSCASGILHFCFQKVAVPSQSFPWWSLSGAQGCRGLLHAQSSGWGPEVSSLTPAPMMGEQLTASQRSPCFLPNEGSRIMISG